MKNIISYLLVPVLIIHFATMSSTAQTVNTYQAFSEGFINPPASARPNAYHWWLGGYVDTVRLKEELVSLKKAGIAGLTIFEIGSDDTILVKKGPAFLSKESLAVIKCAVTEAGKLGMELGLNTASSWNAGGSWITPEHATKSIYLSKVRIAGGEEKRIKIPFPDIPKKDTWGKTRMIKYAPDGKPLFRKEIAVLAIPAGIEKNRLDTAQIIAVTKYFDPQTETLNWKAPSGEWDIFRFVCSNSGENLVIPSRNSAGPIMDHYDAAATEFHFMYIISKLESVLGELRKTALKSLYMASYEAKGFTWTNTLPDVYREINGYDVYKLLPVLFDENFFTPKVRADFKADFQRTLSELMINNFYKKSKEICNRYGLKNNSEAGGPGLPLHNVPVEPLKALGSLDIPRGEFWINHNRLNEDGIDILRVVKEVAAASHIYNRGIVEMEAFTTFQHWQESPAEMKPSGDRAFCEGMNKVVMHGSTHNPRGAGVPGIVYAAGTHFNDKRVWWPKVRPFNEYLSRISWILQEADFVADVLYYYGDTIPNYVGHKNSRFTAGPGYDYEIVNTEILKEVTVKNKKLLLPRSGGQFKILVLANESETDPAVRLKLSELTAGGAVILGSGPKDKQASAMLETMGIGPDFTYPGSEYFTLDYIHYAKDGLNFYFIRNTTNEWISRNCSFRQQGRIPELWNPLSGEIISAGIFNEDKDYISLPLTLAPLGSIFVIFKNGSPGSHFTRIENAGDPPRLEYTKEGIILLDVGSVELASGRDSKMISNRIKEQLIDGTWELIFPKGWGAPERKIFPGLMSWTDSDIQGIKYFSGTVRYKKIFQYDINSNACDGNRLYLDLGDLSHAGEVWLNDKPLGITWTPPHRFDVTDIIKPGDNTLVVEVANTWSNRLSGDAVTGEKFTSTNVKTTNIKGLNKIQVPWKEVPLIRSGLFGPVKIISIKPVSIPGN
jgi:hypothetical protein